jgi:starch-binding outer membrane protein, SusD/RagB family
MKINNYFKVAVIISLFGGIYACSENYLETPIQGAISSSVLSDSESGVNASLISVYKMLNGFTNTVGNTWGSAPSNYIFNSASDDQFKGSEQSDNPDGYYEVSLYQWSPGLGVFSHKFAATYEGVRRANNTITLANEFKAKGGTDAFINKIIGEALFMRVFYHFEGYKMWKNIPYYTEADKDFRKKNDVDIMPLMIADLQKALTLLPDVRGQVGRSDKLVANALLGKILMFKKDFAGAKSALDIVVNSGKFELAPCYFDNFTISTQNNKESIFAHQASVNDGDGNGTNTNFLERLAAPHSGSHTGCCGFNNPTHDFANSFRVDDNGLPVANWNSKRVEVGSADPVDPRLDWSIGRTGVPYLDWGLHSDGWIRGSGWAGLYSPKKNMKLTSDAAGPGWTTNQLHAKNVEFIRFADVLLLLAEAEVEIGSLERARELVNLVRKRAGNCAQGPVGGPISVPIDAVSITWAKYKVNVYGTAWSSKDAARDAVRRERRLELGTEGHRLFDLRRWGNLESTINAFRDYEKTISNKVADKVIKVGAFDAAGPIDAKHYLFPLPSTEIDNSAGNLVQNPGFK